MKIIRAREKKAWEKMKRDEVDLKLQLNVDGTIKKVVAVGDNDELNKLVEVDMCINNSLIGLKNKLF